MDLLMWPFAAQLVAEVLSQNAPTCLYSKSFDTVSMTNHPNTIPANSRLLMDSLVARTNFVMEEGHGNCHAMYRT